MDKSRANIEHLRGRRSLLQIASEAGIQQSWLQRYMHPDKPDGIKKPNAAKLTAVAKVFGVSLEALLHHDLTGVTGGDSQPERTERSTMAAGKVLADHYLASRPGEQLTFDLVLAAMTVANRRGAAGILDGTDLLPALHELAKEVQVDGAGQRA